MGQRLKQSAERRDASIHVRLETDLKEEFKSFARRFGHNPSTWLRWVGELAVRGEVTLPAPPQHGNSRKAA